MTGALSIKIFPVLLKTSPFSQLGHFPFITLRIRFIAAAPVYLGAEVTRVLGSADIVELLCAV